jgi:hypothetical protein
MYRVHATDKDHVGSVVFDDDYDHDLFMVNDKGEFGLTFIIDDLWPHVDQDLRMVYINDDDKPHDWNLF